MQQELLPVSTPVVLVACGDEWLARSIESTLNPQGFRVARALNAKQVLDFMHTQSPAAVLLESRLPDMDGVEICRALRTDPAVASYMPIIIASVGPSARRDRLEALRAGAWDYCDIVPDSEELLLRVNTYTRLKATTDAMRKAGLQDDLTGLYNLQGLLRRLQEVGSDAARYGRALACVAIAPETGPSAAATNEASSRLGRIVASSCRGSDSVARLPNNEFVVLASETTPPGARRLAERVLNAAEEAGSLDEDSPPVRLRAGLYAVWDFTAAAIRPVDMLMRATSALQQSQLDESARIVDFNAQAPAV